MDASIRRAVAALTRGDDGERHYDLAAQRIQRAQREAAYPEVACRLEQDDLVVLYTDGLTEATNERGELYTLARLEENLLSLRERRAQAVVDAIYDAVCTYSAGELRDDATILVLRGR
jgi:phosphoserine phosphatase RsbU/P